LTGAFGWQIPFSVSALAIPSSAAPIIRREDVLLAFDASRSSTVAFLSGWLILLNGHLRIPEADDLRLATFLDEDSRLLPAARRPLHFSVPAELLATVRNHLPFFWAFHSRLSIILHRTTGLQSPVTVSLISVFPPASSTSTGK
jgi:hypothetical protein